jgi:hypothetical protein
MTELQNKIAPYSSIFFDTAPLIYFIEAHPRYGPIMKEFVDAFSESKVMAYTSVVTITEVLAKPVADGKDSLAVQFYNFSNMATIFNYSTLLQISLNLQGN